MVYGVDEPDEVEEALHIDWTGALLIVGAGGVVLLAVVPEYVFVGIPVLCRIEVCQIGDHRATTLAEAGLGRRMSVEAARPDGYKRETKDCVGLGLEEQFGRLARSDGIGVHLPSVPTARAIKRTILSISHEFPVLDAVGGAESWIVSWGGFETKNEHANTSTNGRERRFER